MRLRVVVGQGRQVVENRGGSASVINPSIRIKGYMKARVPVNRPAPKRSLVTISEPTTLATDYLLGTVSEVFGVLLLRQNRRRARRCYHVVGRGPHGSRDGQLCGRHVSRIPPCAEPERAAALWKATTISMGRGQLPAARGRVQYARSPDGPDRGSSAPRL